MAAHREETIALTTSTETLKKCVLGQDLGVGDCVQFAGSSISLQRSEDEEGQATYTWKATTLTHHHPPWGHDTWQQWFRFITADGGIVAKVDTLRGQDMGDNDRNYSIKRTGIVNFNPALWDQITQITWGMEC